jgi:hypothetical protein
VEAAVALSKEQISQIKSRLRQIKAYPGRFVYCPSGPEGDPVLLLDRKRIDAAEIQALRRDARKKKLVRGFVERGESGFIFRTRGEPPPTLRRDLRRFFAPAVPPLRGAEVAAIKRRAGIESLDGDDAGWGTGSTGQDLGPQHVVSQHEAADRADAEASILDARARQLQQQLEALQAQQLSSAFEAERAMDRYEAAASSFNPFTRRKMAARLALALDVYTEKTVLDETVVRTTAELARARAEMDRARTLADSQRAVSGDLLARWSAEQAAFWTARRADPSWLAAAEEAGHAHARARDAAETADNAYRSSREALDADDARQDAIVRVMQLNHDELERLKGELATLDTRPTLSLADVRLQATFLARTDALRFNNDDLEAELEELEQRGPELEADQAGLAARAAATATVARTARGERDRYYMSADEVALSAEQHAERDRARAAAAEARTVQAACHAEVEALRTGLDEVHAARRALVQAQADLFAAQIEREHQEAEASLYRIPGLKGRSARIDAARAALPAASLAEDKAKHALDAAQRALQAAETAESPRVAAISEATEAMLIADQHAAQAAHTLAQCDHRVAEGEARIVGWAEDIQRQQLEGWMESIAEADGDFKSAWQDRDAADDVTAETGEVLVETERYLLQLQEEIATVEATLAEGFDAAALDVLQELLRELPLARAAIEEARGDADYTEQEASEASAAFDERLRELARHDPKLQRLLDDYDAVREDLEDNHQRDADAAERLAGATAGLAEATRRDQVHELHTEASALIERSQDLITRFHHLDDPTDVHSDGVILDLVDPDDRARARAMEGWEALDRFRREVDRLALRMLQQGATTDELAAMLEAVPNGLRPDAWRAEVRSFTALQSALELTEDQREEASVLKAARLIAPPDDIKDSIREKIRLITDNRAKEGVAAAKRIDVLTGRVNAVLDNPLFTDVPEVLETIEGAIGLLGEGLEIVQASEASGRVGLAKARYDEVTSRFVDTMLDLKERGVELFGIVQSVLDTMKGPVDLLANDIIQATVRRGQARHSRLLAQAAKVAGSPLVGAFEEAVARENALWAKYAVSATMDTLDIAGKLAMLYPADPSAAVGAALQLGAAGVRSNLDLAAAVAVDWETARKARELLQKARRGDSRAKAALTHYHPLYAKGLIAYMAREGDPFATLYVSSRGIDAERVQQSSARILAYYLLDDAQQLDGDGELVLETGQEWWQRKKNDWTTWLVGGLAAIRDALQHWMKSDAERARERMLGARRAAAQMADAVIAARKVAANLEARLAAATETDETLERQLGEVTHLLETYNETFSQARQDAVIGLETLGRVEREFAVMSARGAGGLQPDAQRAHQQLAPILPQLRSGYLEIVGSVSRAA